MNKTLVAGLATLLFFLTSIGIAKDWPLAQEDLKNSKVTGLYDNVTILQEQINNLTERLNRIESLHDVEDRFTDMGDGTIRDNDSELIWLKDANCFGPREWEVARILVSDLHDDDEDPICGLMDGSSAGQWRLPTQAEWKALMSTVYINPALVNTVGDAQWSEGDAFTEVVSAYYWCRTDYEPFPGNAWVADMNYGTSIWWDGKHNYNYVWPVRSGN